MATDRKHSLAVVPNGGAKMRRVGGIPFGIGRQKPRHFSSMLRIAWENRDNLGYAYRVLTQGVCDGCALGTTGVHDWTLGGDGAKAPSESVHLCMVRLELLRLNTIGALDVARLSDAGALAKENGKRLRALGRIPHPLRRLAGEAGFSRISWDEALAELGGRISMTDPDRFATYMTSRGIGNEVYYAAQKAVRFLGSPHIDNAARLCHSPSTVAMRRTLGVAASTCSYRDWYGTDLIVFFGSNPANDQPVAMKYLEEAKRRGTRVLAVNPIEEPGMARYWVPSSAASAVLGTVMCDRFFGVATGGDLSFLRAVQRVLIERGAVDRAFVDAHTEGFADYEANLLGADQGELVRDSGATAQEVSDFADELARAKNAVFVWSMGLTQHGHGSATVEALCALGLSRGFIGREKCGLMPIRGHSGVQGGAEMGAYATAFPGGRPVDDEQANALEKLWGFRPPARAGLDTVSMMDAAIEDRLDVFYCIGGNFLDTLPDPARVEASLAGVPVRIHQDIVLTQAMLVPPREAVYILPARTRYEHRGGVTETSTERRVIYSPHVPGHDIGEAKEEWWIALALARAARPEGAERLGCGDAAAIRREIAEVIPAYRGIEKLEKQGDSFQWGGPRLCEGGKFPLPGGKARFLTSGAPPRALAPREFRLATRRGKQFNSMIQGERDPLTGADRDHVLICRDDMAELGLSQDDSVVVKSAHGTFVGRVYCAPLVRGNIQMHWPEANVLLSPGKVDPLAKVPDYNAVVRLERPPPEARGAV